MKSLTLQNTLKWRSSIPWKIIISVIVLVIALKLFYSLALVDDLRFILSPVSLGVELFSGESFHYLKGVGYVANDLAIVINGSCAGINYWIVLILISTFVILYKDRNASWKVWSLSTILAFVYMLIINTIRIASDIQFSRLFPHWKGIGDLSRHSLLSTFIFFFFLVIYYLMMEQFMKYIKKVQEGTNGIADKK